MVAVPSSRELPDPETEPKSLTSPALAGGFFTTSATWEIWGEDMVLPKLNPRSSTCALLSKEQKTRLPGNGPKPAMIEVTFKNDQFTNFPGVQWLRLHPPITGGMGSIPGWGSKIARACMAKKTTTTLVGSPQVYKLSPP